MESKEKHWSNGVMGKKKNWSTFIGSTFQHSNTPVLHKRCNGPQFILKSYI
jgi:hypothetical protein